MPIGLQLPQGDAHRQLMIAVTPWHGYDYKDDDDDEFWVIFFHARDP